MKLYPNGIVLVKKKEDQEDLSNVKKSKRGTAKIRKELSKILEEVSKIWEDKLLRGLIFADNELCMFRVD